MKDQEVLDTLRVMRDNTMEQVGTYRRQLARLQKDYDNGDTMDDTKAAIASAKRRIEKHTAEAEALSLAISNYGTDAVKDDEGKVPEIDFDSVDISRDENKFGFIFFTEEGKCAAQVQTDGVKVQQFAVNLLKLTTEAFEDAAFRLDGLDK